MLFNKEHLGDIFYTLAWGVLLHFRCICTCKPGQRYGRLRSWKSRKSVRVKLKGEKGEKRGMKTVTASNFYCK